MDEHDTIRVSVEVSWEFVTTGRWRIHAVPRFTITAVKAGRVEPVKVAVDGGRIVCTPDKTSKTRKKRR